MNEQNLIQNQQRSPSELREMGRKGGIASGISRSFRSAMKNRIREHPELIEKMIDQLLEEFENGNLKAFDLILELSGESPKQMELAIKKRELKLKEQAMQSGASGEQELPALLKALEENK